MQRFLREMFRNIIGNVKAAELFQPGREDVYALTRLPIPFSLKELIPPLRTYHDISVVPRIQRNGILVNADQESHIRLRSEIHFAELSVIPPFGICRGMGHYKAPSVSEHRLPRSDKHPGGYQVCLPRAVLVYMASNGEARVTRNVR